MRAASRLLMLALLLPLCSCEDTRGGVHVVVDGPLRPGVDFDRLSVVASVPGGAPLSSVALEGAELSLPASFNFESGPATPAGTRVSVEATAELAGVVRSTTSGEAVLTEKSGARLDLTLPGLPPRPDSGIVESCDNGLDDDGDGLRDCADPDCDGAMCQPGGLTCASRRCGCAGGVVGVVVERPGFTGRLEPMVLAPFAGPYAGALMMLGGKDGAGNPTSTWEAFFPGTGQFVKGALSVPRAEATALALEDGGVALLGGVREGAQPESSVEWFFEDGGTRRVPLLPSLSARKVLSGRLGSDVVLAGGSIGQGTSAPVTDAVVRVRLDGAGGGNQQALGTLSRTCSASGAMLGDAFAVAGACAGSPPSDRVDVVEPAGALTTGPLLPVALTSPALVDLPGGRVLVLGGREALTQGGTAPTARAFILERSGTATRVREILPMDVPRGAPRAVRTGPGWVYVEDAEGAPPAWFDPAAERFLPATPPPTSRAGHTLSGSREARAYVVGGRGPDTALLDTALFMELRCP